MEEDKPIQILYQRVYPCDLFDDNFDFLKLDEIARKQDHIREDAEKKFREKNPNPPRFNTVCKFFLQGRCQFEDYECKYLHIYDERLFPECQFYKSTGSQCTNPDCSFRHPDVAEQVECVSFAKGFCKDGPKCMWVHVKQKASQLENVPENVHRAIKTHQKEKQRRQNARK